jgi:hypothetical protein
MLARWQVASARELCIEALLTALEAKAGGTTSVVIGALVSLSADAALEPLARVIDSGDESDRLVAAQAMLSLAPGASTVAARAAG